MWFAEPVFAFLAGRAFLGCLAGQQAGTRDTLVTGGAVARNLAGVTAPVVPAYLVLRAVFVALARWRHWGGLAAATQEKKQNRPGGNQSKVKEFHWKPPSHRLSPAGARIYYSRLKKK
ncbi:MAG: hypothetical protein D6806_12390 [Deltaproteobacteria bacterium]|nr:MAG: hypothetical protein D6806_12390 [Deltaproteobacteria bacterium]